MQAPAKLTFGTHQSVVRDNNNNYNNKKILKESSTHTQAFIACSFSDFAIENVRYRGGRRGLNQEKG